MLLKRQFLGVNLEMSEEVSPTKTSDKFDGSESSVKKNLRSLGFSETPCTDASLLADIGSRKNRCNDFSAVQQSRFCTSYNPDDVMSWIEFTITGKLRDDLMETHAETESPDVACVDSKNDTPNSKGDSVFDVSYCVHSTSLVDVLFVKDAGLFAQAFSLTLFVSFGESILHFSG